MAEKKDASQRPPDSDFQQQNLKAWQPLLTPAWVIGTFIFIGVLFSLIGAWILSESEKVVVVERRYDNFTNAKLQGFELDIPKDMGGNGEKVYFYYKLTEFYQNHRRYVKSRNDAQLRGQNPDDISSCGPLAQWPPGELQMYPCGLIADSYFSDNFTDPTLTRAGADVNFSWGDKGIAWDSDKEYKFNEGPFDPAKQTKVGPSGVDLDDFYNREDFIVWMRTAGLPNFKKLRYIITTPLLKGDILKFNIGDNFADFGGTKSVVLSTTSALGGKNTFLGIAYITVAAICIILAIAFALKHKIDPRTLGDMRYFNWHGAAASD